MFATLTYDAVHQPLDNSLNHRHWQLFAKRLRKARGPFRYYMAGEYGDQLGRPHYHAILFGIDFPDKTAVRQLADKPKLYHSEELDKLWGRGNCTLGAVTFESAAYVARYVMKKITGDLAPAHYTWIDEHGEMHERRPEYNHMSRRPGVGHNWITKYLGDVFPSDGVQLRNYECKPPRYYDKQLEKTNPEMHERIKQRRKDEIDHKDNTQRRLNAKEKVALAKHALYKRPLE